MVMVLCRRSKKLAYMHSAVQTCLIISSLTSFTQSTLAHQRQQHMERHRDVLGGWVLLMHCWGAAWKCCLLSRYCGPDQAATEQYPFNPNGSPEGIAALCSPNGRHLAIMPHPERCFLMWQNPWFPRETGLQKDGPSPWLKLFQNAREWCESL